MRILKTDNFDVARKPPDISGAQADNSFAKISKNLLTSTA
jgi:hypothetical protein